MDSTRDVLATTVETPAAKEPSRLQTLSKYVVLTQRHPIRTVWSVIVAVLLVYTGTVLPFRLAFIDLAIPHQQDPGVLDPIDLVVDVIFWVDLFINFCFTYVDANGKEVTQIPLLVSRYLRTYFLINLIACLPTETIGWILNLFHQSGNDHGLHKTLRLARLQRVSRLARLVRLVRLAKFFAIMRENPVWNWIQSLRGVRIINLCCSLLWSVHIVACGWYMCAAFHFSEGDTWVARREIGPNGETLLNASMYTHWINSMYFVLTVFTTVGFGDMSAWTVGEIVYVCFTMVLGCIVNSIILSSVITILTNVDHEARQVDEQRMLLEAFAKHTHLDNLMTLRLTKWVSATVPIQPNFDRSWLKQLLTSRSIPRDLAGDLLAHLFDGHLMKNKFMSACQGYIGYHIPPRFPLITALLVNMQYFHAAEIVYFPYDNAWNLFMILSGVFSHFAVPSPAGGSVETAALLADPNMMSASRSEKPRTSGSGASVLPKMVAQMSSQPGRTSTVRSMPRDAPYQILGHGSYFGEYELLHTRTRARETGVRCEVDGCTLVLAKDCLGELMAEFPFVARSWRNASAHRDSHRRRLLRRHVKKMSVHTLAATTIQRFVRARQRRGDEPRERGESSASDIIPLNNRSFSANSGTVDGDAGGQQGELAELRAQVRQIHAMLSDLHKKFDVIKKFEAIEI